MLSLGFLFALWPALRVVYPDKDERRAAIIRHLAFFNTHPYFANGIMGVVINVESSERGGGPDLDEEITRIKRAMMGAFGALGDDLFWAGLMPAASLLALIGFAFWPRGALAAAAVAFVAYNVFHLWARVRLFNVSLRLGRRVTRYLRMLQLPRAVVIVKAVGALVLGVFTVALVIRGGAAAPSPLAGGLAVVSAAGASLALFGLRVKPGQCWFIVMAAAGAAGVFLL
jgi:PTS system mannose-specific IID component